MLPSQLHISVTQDCDVDLEGMHVILCTFVFRKARMHGSKHAERCSWWQIYPPCNRLNKLPQDLRVFQYSMLLHSWLNDKQKCTAAVYWARMGKHTLTLATEALVAHWYKTDFRLCFSCWLGCRSSSWEFLLFRRRRRRLDDEAKKGVHETKTTITQRIQQQMGIPATYSGKDKYCATDADDDACDDEAFRWADDACQLRESEINKDVR